MIPLFKVRMATDAPHAVGRVLLSGYIGQGPKASEFEERLAERLLPTDRYTGLCATNSATSAEQLAFRVMSVKGEIQPGDEVLTTPLTCTATNWAILASNLKPGWVDIDPATMNVDLDDLGRKINSKTRAIVVVHWGGYPVDMAKLEEICRSANLEFGTTPRIIQDCAHAFGSTLRGQPLSAWGDFAFYSFQAIKHLTCGDGGALVTSDPEDQRQARLLRWYGIDREGPRGDIENWGLKLHMNDIAASVGLANLALVEETLAMHRDNAAFYDRELSSLGPELQILEREAGFDSASWLYTVRVERRAAFTAMMASSGIEVSQVHERNDAYSCVADFRTSLPKLDAVSDDMICIPVGWWVTEADREHIVSCIKQGWV